MKTLPASVQCIVDQCIDDVIRPLCVVLDRNFIIQSWSGDYAYYGFEGIDVGKDCRDSLLFLVGLQANESFDLRFIETPNHRSVHIHAFVESRQIILVLLDASEQRLNQTVLQQKGNELALMQIEQLRLIENLKRLEKEVESKRRLAEQANQLKGQFIATMSHEFRTPLTSILGYSLRLKSVCESDQIQTSYLESIERGAKHLLSLVENLLDHAQIEVGSLSINPIATDVTVVMEKLASIFEPLAEDKDLGFEISISSNIPDYLCLDEMRFRQILVNLISNAIKFTDEGVVSVHADWLDGGLSVSVKDTGKGIAESDRQRIFSAFEQLGNEPGTGLGLSIVKHLVQAMDGKLTVDSAVARGSHFVVQLPARQVSVDSNAREADAEKSNSVDSKTFLNTVLLVEDDPDIMTLLQTVFDDIDCKSLTASNGNDGLNLALTEWPDFILLDLNLPGMTGFEVIKSLRNNQFKNPVFIHSAWVSSEYKAQAMAIGCNEYVLKPLDLDHLNSLISEYFFIKKELGMPVERYRQIYQQFLDSLPGKHELLEQLEQKNNQRHWDSSLARRELHQYAHRLAGSAEMYGMQAMAKTAKRLDQLLLDYEDTDAQNDKLELRKKIIKMITKLHIQFDQMISKA